ncbi:PIN domain-containing protein [Methylobacterium sp. 17Sr1-1]|uniref:PIN domain-containing protein n=1 Tax=Methylobacterium sp. 17Sr1-1 TaxID=2202826 RepID=UPI000D6FBCD3|nr:PIN domain-containing protein [Methylobacterium sp. 17Sr1-1]AWN54193.1 VapC toxin family PIN domain ribonuclease [Methylobacterium sp. 17Sr1-1]
MYLVDTNILSQGAPTKETDLAFRDLADWLEAAADHLWLSVVTVAEVMAGIERSMIRGEPRKAARLRAWLDVVEHLYGPRILPLDRDAARLTGILSARAQMRGASPGFADAAIAATAELRGLCVLTRNAKDFAPMGVAFVNPYESGVPPIPG